MLADVRFQAEWSGPVVERAMGPTSIGNRFPKIICPARRIFDVQWLRAVTCFAQVSIQ
jgi:hypothetical protein